MTSSFQEVIEAVLEHNKIRRDPLSRIAPQLRRKQLYRMHLLGIANGMKSTLAGSAKFATTPTTTTQETTTTAPQDTVILERTTTPPMRTTTPDLETAVPTRARPWLTYKPRDRHTTRWRSMHFDKYTTTVGVSEITAPQRTSTMMEEVTGEPVRIEGDVTTMPPPSDEVTSTDQPTLTTMSRQTTEIVFFTHTRPSTFRDPKCRDMRYSCAFWLQHNPVVCTEQESFMKAQCAYTCKFCISELDAKDAQEIARKKH
ncbi:shTK domain protein [Ancylostoma duodenale]|uniref:ShTK domain protein n=1 Tax=Ancylostoma duodenale TaxID=51022 RepID=A0A0C2GX50_9BILA|nr:shTK domain protein [Ancylostoma duodenale]